MSCSVMPVENDEDRWPIDLEKIVGQRVRQLREAAGLTQQELGASLFLHGEPLHQTTVAKLEAGTRPLRLNDVGALAAFFDVPIESLWQSEDVVDEELREALAKVHEMGKRALAAKRASETASERAKVAAEVAHLAREDLEAAWLREHEAMAVYETLLRTRKGSHGKRQAKA